MATKVLDLDLAEWPQKIDKLEGYEKVLILYRYRGYPLGRTLLPVHNGRVNLSALSDNIFQKQNRHLQNTILKEKIGATQVESTSLPTATIAICTHNRPNDVKRCLESLLKLQNDGQEILVVDNCPSGDETFNIVARYGGSIKYVLEERRGLNVARNRALREASGDIVAFIDDDALVDPNWLRALLINFDHPLVLCVTGLTMPFELETEAQEMFERYSTFCRGFQRIVFNRHSLRPWAAGRAGAGVNMALRRSVLYKVGPFDEALDAGTTTQAGGETELFSRILKGGFRIVYDPSAINWHRHRKSREALRQTLYGYSVGIYAFWTRQLLFEGELYTLLAAWRWFWQHHLKNLARSILGHPGRMPLDLVLAEIHGCLAGPGAYLQSRKKLQASICSRR
jgi:glycosyltransferase involved in cell wall biosynthesis